MDDYADEPKIIINGVSLNHAQAMTVRVALETFEMHLADGLGNDETGIAICNGYRRCIREIRKYIFYRANSEMG